MASKLNEDVLYLIFSYLASDMLKNRHLAPLALVSKEWNAVATILLYQKPELFAMDYQRHGPALKKLMDTVHGNPSLAEHVRTLTFSSAWCQPQVGPDSLVEQLMLCPRVNSVLVHSCTPGALRSILDVIIRERRTLKNLQIAFKEWFWEMTTMEKETLPVGPLSIRLVSLPRLQTLYLSYFHTSANLMWITPVFKLRSLALYNCSLSKRDLLALLTSSSHSLRSLHLELVLSEYTRKWSADDLLCRNDLGPILRSTVGPSLQHLTLGDRTRKQDRNQYPSTISLDIFSRLITLTVITDLRAHPFLDQKAPRSLRRLWIVDVTSTEEDPETVEKARRSSVDHPWMEIRCGYAMFSCAPFGGVGWCFSRLHKAGESSDWCDMPKIRS